jgi:hypothetical protein
MSVTIEHSVASWTKRENTILSMVVARCWRDADYRAALQADPRGVFAAEGLHVPAEFELRVVERREQLDATAGDLVRYVVIPATPADLDSASAEYDLVRRAAVARPGILDPQGWVWGPVAELEAAVTTTTTTAEAEAEVVIVLT